MGPCTGQTAPTKSFTAAACQSRTHSKSRTAQHHVMQATKLFGDHDLPTSLKAPRSFVTTELPSFVPSAPAASSTPTTPTKNTRFIGLPTSHEAPQPDPVHFSPGPLLLLYLSHTHALSHTQSQQAPLVWWILPPMIQPLMIRRASLAWSTIPVPPPPGTRRGRLPQLNFPPSFLALLQPPRPQRPQPRTRASSGW
jgi:hypothetical protein